MAHPGSKKRSAHERNHFIFYVYSVKDARSGADAYVIDHIMGGDGAAVCCALSKPLFVLCPLDAARLMQVRRSPTFRLASLYPLIMQ